MEKWAKEPRDQHLSNRRQTGPGKRTRSIYAEGIAIAESRFLQWSNLGASDFSPTIIGRITGKPDVTAGAFNVKVTVAYYAGSSAVRFPWLVSSPPGPVKGYDAKCVDSAGGSAKNGSKIDIWSCTGKAAQQITFTSSGELSLLGSCVTRGAAVSLEPCKGTSNQVWTRLANRSYVLKLNGKCLTDPGSAKRNGTGLTVAACKNTANQHWSLP